MLVMVVSNGDRGGDGSDEGDAHGDSSGGGCNSGHDYMGHWYGSSAKVILTVALVSGGDYNGSGLVEVVEAAQNT